MEKDFYECETLSFKLSVWWFDFKECTWGIRHLYKFKRWLKNVLYNRYDLVRSKLPKGEYHDTVELMLHANMEMLVSYVEVEDCFSVIDFDDCAKTKKLAYDIKEIYLWWKAYDNRQKEIANALNIWHDEKFKGVKGDGWLEAINKKDTPKVKKLSDTLFKLEENLAKEEEKMLIKLMKIRTALWT